MLEEFRRSLVPAVNDRFFYGWTLVGVASLALFASGPGQSHTFGVFSPEISRDLGITTTEITMAYGLATLVAAFALPLMGRLVDRFGPRCMLIAIVLLLGLSCLFFGAAANLLWLSLGFAILRFLGQGSLALACANMISHWFSRSRGFAMSLMAAGFGVSIFVHPFLSQTLLELYDWRTAWVILGVMTWVLMLPPVIVLVFDRPEPLGLRPDGDAPAADAATAEAEADIPGLTLQEALRTPTFYILTFGWTAIAGLVTLLHYHQKLLLTGQGIDVDLAVSAFSVTAISMLVAMPFVGRLFDRFRTRYVYGAALVLTGLSLIAVTLVDDTATLVAYAILFGINNAFSMTVFGYIWPRYFGRRHLGSIQGVGQMVGVVGASLGPLPVGLAIDLGWDPAATVQSLALYPFLAAAITILFIRAPAGLTESAHLE